MLALMRKEWRESRVLVLAFLVLAPLMSLGLKWGLVGWERTFAYHSVVFVIPGMLLLFLLAVAADLVAGDAASGRIAFLAALPVRAGTLWSAKALYLLVAAAAYLAWLFVVEGTILALAGKDVGWFLEEARARLPFLPLIPMVGAGVLLFSTLLERGIAAAFASFLALAAIAGLVAWFDPPRFGLDYKREVLQLSPFVAAILTLAFLTGSFLAFTRGRIWVGTRLRRVAFGAAGFLLVAAPPAAWAGFALESWARIHPDDPDMYYSLESVDPGGRWLIAAAARSGEGPLGADKRIHATFAVRVGDGLVRNLPPRLGMRPWRPWDGDGRVVLLDPRGSVETVWDLDADEPVRTQPAGTPFFESPFGHRVEKVEGRWRVAAAGREPVEVPEGWRLLSPQSPWGIGVHRWKRRKSVFGVMDLVSGAVTELPSYPYLLPETRDGRPFTADREDLGRRIIARTAPDCRRCVVLTDRGVFLVRSDGSEPARLGGPLGVTGAAVLWAPDSKSFLTYSNQGTWRGSAEGGPLVPFPLDRVGLSESRIQWFDGRNVIVTRYGDLLIVTEGGRERRLLPSGG